MDIIISNSSNIPLYEQIAEQIKQQILTGQLAKGTALPSIRTLAKELKVSIITTKRSYEELEREGFVETIGGKGTYVAFHNLEQLREVTLVRIEEKLNTIVEEAKSIGLSQEDLITILSALYEEE